MHYFLSELKSFVCSVFLKGKWLYRMYIESLDIPWNNHWSDSLKPQTEVCWSLENDRKLQQIKNIYFGKTELKFLEENAF